jgi:hypothetical protein
MRGSVFAGSWEMKLTRQQHESAYRIKLKDPRNYEPIFRHLAGLGHNMSKLSLNVVQEKSGLNKQRALQFLRELEEEGLAKVRGGGGGVESYLEWADGIDPREVGRASEEPIR